MEGTTQKMKAIGRQIQKRERKKGQAIYYKNMLNNTAA